VAGALIALLTACSTSGRSFDTWQMNQIIPGQTTLEQAAVILKAQPENIYRQQDGSAMARWAHKASMVTDAVYFRRELWLQFGSDGRFQHVVNRVNVIAEPGHAAPVAAPRLEQVGLGTVPAGFPYSTDIFHGPTAVYPVR